VSNQLSITKKLVPLLQRLAWLIIAVRSYSISATCTTSIGKLKEVIGGRLPDCTHVLSSCSILQDDKSIPLKMNFTYFFQNYKKDVTELLSGELPVLSMVHKKLQ
jgi:hypothetical protein